MKPIAAFLLCSHLVVNSFLAVVCQSHRAHAVTVVRVIQVSVHLPKSRQTRSPPWRQRNCASTAGYMPSKCCQPRHTQSITPRLRVPSINDTKAAVPWHTNPLSPATSKSTARIHPKPSLSRREASLLLPQCPRNNHANTYCWHKPHGTTTPKSRTRHPNQPSRFRIKTTDPTTLPPHLLSFPKPPYPHMPPLSTHTNPPPLSLSRSHQTLLVPPAHKTTSLPTKTSPQDPHFGAPPRKSKLQKKKKP